MPSLSKPTRAARPKRKKVSVSAELDARIKALAVDCGMTESKWMRQVLEHAAGAPVKKPQRKRRRDADLLAHGLNSVGLQLKRLGTNLNQLAKQANTGLVAVSRAEMQYVLNQQQLVLSKCMTLLERADG
jgi:glycerol kinase